MFTPEIKDRILSYLCETVEFEGVCVVPNEELLRLAPVDLNELDAFFKQLVRMRLVGYQTEVITEDKSYVFLYLEAQDFLRIGGFTAKETVLKQSVEKLQLEVEKLRQNPSDALAAITNVTTIATNILSFLR